VRGPPDATIAGETPRALRSPVHAEPPSQPALREPRASSSPGRSRSARMVVHRPIPSRHRRGEWDNYASCVAPTINAKCAEPAMICIKRGDQTPSMARVKKAEACVVAFRHARAISLFADPARSPSRPSIACDPVGDRERGAGRRRFRARQKRAKPTQTHPGISRVPATGRGRVEVLIGRGVRPDLQRAALSRPNTPSTASVRWGCPPWTRPGPGRRSRPGTLSRSGP